MPSPTIPADHRLRFDTAHGSVRSRAASTWRLPAIAMLALTASLVTAAPIARAAIIDASDAASATLAPASGSAARGSATFTSAGDDGIRIVVVMQGLSAGSTHGMHIHQAGDCSAPDATSAGPHFALDGQRHGSAEGTEHHAGDLGNLTADAGGAARVELVVSSKKLTVTPGPLSVVGRAIVVHAKVDDLKSQPAGDSGARIACGVISRDTVGSGSQAPTKPGN